MDVRLRRTGTVVVALVMLSAVLGFFILQQPSQQQRKQGDISASINGSAIPSPTAPPIPSPVGTFTYPSPQPADTPGPTWTPAPLPRPPAPTILAFITTTPNPLPSPPPSPFATVTQAVTPGRPVSKASAAANIAWGAETPNDLTIWTGAYDDSVPNIVDAKAIVKWASPLKLVGMVVSPDHQSLAVLTLEPLIGEGFPTYWLSVINLSNYTVQSIPDYDNHYDLYKYYYPRSPDRILGWIDNDKFVVQQTGDLVAAVAGKDGASYSRVPFPPQFSSAAYTALSPDRNRLFSDVGDSGGNGGFWTYNIDGTNPQKLVDMGSERESDYPAWSPDGKFISFLSPKISLRDGTKWSDSHYMGLWLLNLATKEQKSISSENVWDVDPTWSDDSSKIAFLRADAPITDNDRGIWYGAPETVYTNIFIANISNLTPTRLTHFDKVSNSGLQWTPGGSLLLASTSGSSSGLRNLGVVSTSDGTFTMLIAGSTNESLVHPLIFK